MSDMEEDYGFEYSEEEDDQPDIDIENQYYNAKALIESDPQDALEGFRAVIDMEREKGEWGFKAHKQIVKLLFKKGKYEDMMKTYRQQLTYIKSAVTRNFSEKRINSILDFVSSSQQTELLQTFYQTTLDALVESKNDRLWFKTQLKLGKLLFDREEYPKLGRLIKELHKSCQNEDGTDDHKKGTQLLEIYALEIQLYTETKNNKKLKDLYQRSLLVKSAIPHPRIMGVIRECGGKMHMTEREWRKAHTDFFEAFKNYDECGSPRRIQCLKYLVLANMLMMSEIDPFDSQEAKPYKNDPEILAMTNLVSSYMRGDIKEFEKILSDNKRTIMEDPFIRNYIEDLLKNIRTQVLTRIIRPYTKITLQFISKELNIPQSDVESLLVGLILDNCITGRIDQVNQLLVLDSRTKDTQQYQALEKWSHQLLLLQSTPTAKFS